MKYNDEFEKEFNTLLVDTFHNILKTELQLIKKMSNTQLSMREIHLIEIVEASAEPITIGGIAKSLNITLASVTVMVNKLASAGYLIKKKGVNDGRTTYLESTKKGREIEKKHQGFHKTMIEKIAKKFTDFEREIVCKVVKIINQFFGQDIKEKA